NVLSIQTHNQSVSSSDLSSRAFLSFGINNSSANYGTTPTWFVAPLVFEKTSENFSFRNLSKTIDYPEK
ncbi:MAG: hypothetical protein P8H33_07335, partial [Crocinitomicaceae bacterium]|nr:hypothetical protein [Crocinitomicaceae bacterium]